MSDPLRLRFDLRNPAFAGVSGVERYQAAVEMAAWADRLGGDRIILPEHHGSFDSYLPSPLTLAAAIASRTSTIRIGIMSLIAPFHDPLRLAEDIAVVDLLSGGRLDVMVAGGYVAGEFAMFDVPMSARAARVQETVETLKAAWTGEEFTFRGRAVRVRPVPAQPGGPRIVLGGSSEAAARRAARIADGFLPTDARWWPFYVEECAALGKPDPGPAPASSTEVVVLDRDPEAAWADLVPYFLHERNAYGVWHAQADSDTSTPPVAGADELQATAQYRVLTPEAYVEEVRAGGPAALAAFHPMVGGIPPARAWQSLRLYEEAAHPKLG